jgi:hypothetical protein
MAAKGKTAATAAARGPVDVQAIRREATARVIARRTSPEYVTGQHPASGKQFRIQLERPEFLPPVSGAEWWDDRIARFSPQRGGGTAVLFAIAAAARGGGQAAAVAEAARGRSLSVWDQWFVYANLANWAAQNPHEEAGPALRAVLREWQRLGLAVVMPDDPIPVITLNQAELDASDKRRRQRKGLAGSARLASLPSGF